jgi:hypothetical protein
LIRIATSETIIYTYILIFNRLENHVIYRSVNSKANHTSIFVNIMMIMVNKNPVKKVWNSRRIFFCFHYFIRVEVSV